MTASQGVIQLFAFATSIVIARHLTPFEVGLAAEALVFASLALVIVDFGFAAVLVQRPTLSEDDKSTAFWVGMLLGVTLTLSGIALSWPIADLYGDPEVQPLLAVLSLAFIFTAPGIVQAALLVRELDFRSLEIRTIVATALSCATGIVLAVIGFGSWAIIAQDLVITAVSSLLLWRASTWRPSFRFSIPSLRGMAAYTGNVFGTQMLSWATANVDNLLVGRFVGAGPLGAYTVAFAAVLTPVNRIAEPIAHVFFPAFSRIGEVKEIAALWLRAVRMVAFVVVPLMLGLIAVAPDFVHALFGHKWDSAIPIIQILAPVGLIQALVSLNDGVLQAVNRTRILFRFTIVLSAASIVAFAVGLPWGIVGVSVAFLLVTVVLQPLFVRITARTVGRSFGDWIGAVWRIVAAGLLMMLVTLALREALVAADVAGTGRLAILIVVGAAIYLPLVIWMEPQVRVELRAVRERRRPKEPAGSAEGELLEPTVLPPYRGL